MTETVRDLLDRARTAEHQDPVKALSLIQQARSLAHSAGDHFGEAEALYRLASLIFYEGRADEAFALAVEARDLAAEHGNHLVVAWALNLLGIVHLGAGNYSEALQSCLQSVDRYRMTDHRVDEGNHLNTVASVYHALGDTDRAIVTCEAALAANRELNRPDFDAITLANMASLRAERREYLLAVSLGEQALELAREHAVSFTPQILASLGEAYVGIGDPERAIQLLEEALEILGLGEQGDGPPNPTTRATTLRVLGRAASAKGDPLAAVAHLDEGLALATASGQRAMELSMHEALIEVHKILGNYEDVARHLEARFEVNRQLFNEGTDLRIRTLQIAHDTQQARQQAEILRLRTTELQQLVDGRTSALESHQFELLEQVVLLAAEDPSGSRALDEAIGALSVRLAIELGLPTAWSDLLRRAAALRDVGDVKVVGGDGRQRPMAEALGLHASPSTLLQMVGEISRARHEHWDGSGSPEGLHEEAIPMAARIVAVAEAYCSVGPPRSRTHDVVDRAVQHVYASAGRRLDPQIVEALRAIVERDHPGAVTASPRLVP